MYVLYILCSSLIMLMHTRTNPLNTQARKEEEISSLPGNYDAIMQHVIKCGFLMKHPHDLLIFARVASMHVPPEARKLTALHKIKV